MRRGLLHLTAAALVGWQSAAWCAAEDGRARPELEVLWERYWEQDDLTVEGCADLIRHYSPLVRTWAAYSLGRRGAAAMPVVMEALRDADPRVRRAGLDAIAGPVALGTGGRRDKHGMTPEVVADAVPLIAENLKHPDMWVRDGALLAFTVTGRQGAEYLPDIVEYLSSTEDWWLRDAAARAIGGLGREYAQEAIAPLAKAYVRETHVVAQRKMQEALFRLDLEGGAGQIVPVFIEALRRPTQHQDYDTWYFQSATLDVLERMGPSAKAAIPAVEELLGQCMRELAVPGISDRAREDAESRKQRLERALEAIRGANGT